MNKEDASKALAIMDKRFGHDSIISVATVCDGLPFVRNVDAYYENGSFYVVTYLLSNKMKQIAKNENVAVCGEWFTARGKGENLGWICDEKNKEIADKLRNAFAAWFSNGHVDETDKNTVILRVSLNSGILIAEESYFEIDFSELFNKNA